MDLHREFPVPPSDIHRYETLMTSVARRLLEAQTLCDAAQDERDVMYSALQIRMAIEEVGYASFVGNRSFLASVAKRDPKKWKDVRNHLRKHNASYWPVGYIALEDFGTGQLWLRHPDALSEEESVREWGHLSRILHANPLAIEHVDWQQELDYQRKLLGRFFCLITKHFVELHGQPFTFACELDDERVRIIGYRDDDRLLTTVGEIGR
ncbi:hypothetical protein GC584_06725 [Corynebacterium sp. zg912]|uniref:AbiV family abortive infection protein n=1 Tax=Corynebacterium wankanglinii TaxID=2735136 RepID=A0A7V9A261_9CORY|nr:MULTISPECIES: hypothetical protein [Corynebacterium]MBA1837783.1 hypothetical protein [Corynebacterium wankanglinii]MCR5929112.1 hypothetical protein [Corynebacterium sp. zg912]